jgi:hypothetical protein
MTVDPLDDYIDAVGKAPALPIEDAWKPAVRANLAVSLRLARLVDVALRVAYALEEMGVAAAPRPGGF